MTEKIDNDSDYYDYDSFDEFVFLDVAYLWKGFHPAREENIPTSVKNMLLKFREDVSRFTFHFMTVLFGTITEPFETTLETVKGKLDSSVEKYGLISNKIITLFLDDFYVCGKNRCTKFRYDSNPFVSWLGNDPKTIQENWAILSTTEHWKTIISNDFIHSIMIDRETLKDYAMRYRNGDKPPFLYPEVRKLEREATGPAKNKTRIVPGEKTMRRKKNDFRKGWQVAFKAKAKQKAKKLETTRITEISATALNAIYKKAGLTKNDYDPAKTTQQQWAKEVRDELRLEGYDVPDPVGRSKN